ncbi:MAG TPA: aminotransferase class I/II-fold pyridoxal phosphate-dependent enzyme [Polyangiaceae bacterium]|nr:aminotransferase class I/II-fold pyridoxal phosphate-dependent enzyme [Polyangiaceae bacterium]
MRPAPFALERFFARYEFCTEYLLASSDCEARSVGDLLALEPGARDALERLWLGYTEPAGAPALREAIGATYAGAPGVLVCSGAEEAIFAYAQALLEPGDHVVAVEPCYQSLAELPRALGCELSPWPLRAEGGSWRLDPDELAALVRPRTALVVVNSPHNPTGFHFDRGAFERVVAIARRAGARLLSDEVYRGLEYGPGAALPPACERYERATSLGVMSKAYGLAGLRIGWLATHDREALAGAAAIKDYTTICNSAPSELFAALALRHGDALLQRNRALVAANLAIVRETFGREGSPFRWLEPQAGPVAFPALRAGVDDASLCARLAERHGVLLAPGSLFGRPGHVRVGFGRANAAPALARLDEALASDPGLLAA